MESPWSNFRGDHRNSGRSKYIGPHTNELKWSFETHDSITSTAAVNADGTVYFGSNDFSLYALTSHGSFMWKYQTDGIVASSPAIGLNGTIYFGSYDSYFYALTPSGSLLWNYDTGNSIDSSPVIGPSSNAVYFTSNDMFLYALSLQSGSLIWRRQIVNNGFTITVNEMTSMLSSPVVGSDNTVYIGSVDKNVYALSSSGTLLWTFPCVESIFSSPVLNKDEGIVYIASSLFDGDKQSSVSSFYLYAISTSIGSQTWRVTLLAPVFSTPVLGIDGTLYFTTRNFNIFSYLYSISSHGSIIWKVSSSSSYALETQSSPVLGADGTLYFSTAGSTLYAISSSTGSVIWSHKHQNTFYKSASPCISADGVLYIGSYDGFFYAYQSSSVSDSSIITNNITLPPSSSDTLIEISVDGYQVNAPWSHYRGDSKYAGQSSLTGPLPSSQSTSMTIGSNDGVTSSDNNIQLKWKFLTKSGIFATPAISADGTVYIGSSDGKLYALSSLGTLKWSYLITNQVFVTTPSVGYDGTIFLAPDNKYVYALSSKGTLRWKYSTFAGVSSPIIGRVNNNIHVGNSSNNNSVTNTNSSSITNASSTSGNNFNTDVSIYAAGKYYAYAWTYEGSLKWQYALNSAITHFHEPILGMNNSVLYLSTSDSYLCALSTAEGSFLWRYRIDTPFVSQSLMFPASIGADDVIYFATYDSHIYAISPSGSKLWKYQYSAAFIIPTDLGDARMPGVAIASNGNIYVGSKDYSLYAVSTSSTNRSTLWHYKTAGEIYSNPVIGVDGTVYFGSFDKYVYAISGQGSLLWKYLTFRSILGSAVIGYNNSLYIASLDSYIYAITSAGQTDKGGLIHNTVSPTSIAIKDNAMNGLSTQTRILIGAILGMIAILFVCIYSIYFYRKSLQKKHENKLLEMRSWILSDGGGDVKVATSKKEKLEKELFFDEFHPFHSKNSYNATSTTTKTGSILFGDMETTSRGHGINIHSCGSNDDLDDDYDDVQLDTNKWQSSNGGSGRNQTFQYSHPSVDNDEIIATTPSQSTRQLLIHHNDISDAADSINASNARQKVNEYIQYDQQLTQVTNSLKASNILVDQHLEALQKRKSSKINS